MTDMTAFERQLSSEISGLMGPVRPVDDLAVFEDHIRLCHDPIFQIMDNQRGVGHVLRLLHSSYYFLAVIHH